MSSPQTCYATHGPMTDPGLHADLFNDLPASVADLCRIVQGVMVHVFWAERYGLVVPEERKGELQTRPVERKLARIMELDDHPLTVERPLDRRLVGNCRDFATLLCAMLRHQGVPARARCGFGTYFLPDHYEDHWVCEYWHAGESRWVTVDAQLDSFQQEALHISFDTLDMPAGQFVTGGEAWQLCRAGETDPDAFGIFDMHGLWFVRGDLIRDVASLNKVETLPWDVWGLIAGKDEEISEEDMQFLDHVAALTMAGDEAIEELQTLYTSDDRLRILDDSDILQTIS